MNQALFIVLRAIPVGAVTPEAPPDGAPQFLMPVFMSLEAAEAWASLHTNNAPIMELQPRAVSVDSITIPIKHEKTWLH